MATEAKYANGESVIPQARPNTYIEWAYANGESGSIGADEYVAAGGLSIAVAMNNMRGGFNPIGMRGGFIN